MADAVVSITLQTLQRLVTEEARFLSGVTDQVEEIAAELKRMQLFLKDADSRTHDDESVRNWLREIRILAYKVEDIVEAFAVEVASNRRRGVKNVLKRFACMVCEAKSLHNLGLEIEKAKRDISNLTTSLQRYDIKAIGSRESSENRWWGRQTYVHEVEEHFVGMEEDMQKLVSLVLDEDKRYRVISIWGMGGLGKTTLARRIYKHNDVQRKFEGFAWACVTQHGQIRSILQDILMQFAPAKKAEVKGMGDRELVQELNQVQKGRKCLVVLDDIWKADDWKNLLAAFPIAEGSIKILLTTRDRKIAEIGFPYAPKFLTETESWELLQSIACSQKNVDDFKLERRLEDVGVEMARKCGGLPLAISVLGGILKDKISLTEWQMVNKYISSFLCKVEDDPDGGVVARVLSLSYSDLPYYLKPCFLYMASFQDGEMIFVEQLYRLWMAEGMVLSQHKRSDEPLMEVAERYLDELVRRSMVQARLESYQTAKKYFQCSLHDMMRDVCLEKSREEEFIEVLDFEPVRQPLFPSPNFACRLVLRMDDEVVKGAAKPSATARENYQQLRSVWFLGRYKEKEFIWPQGMVYLQDSKSLRVLQFEGYDFHKKKLPVELQKFIHLRYFNVNNCTLDELPSSVAELPLLQTLHIVVNNEIKLPNVLCKMKQLRHLYLGIAGHYTENGKLRLHGLSELETLNGLNSTTDEVSDLAGMLNLRVLVATICDEKSLRVFIDHVSINGQKLKGTCLCIVGFDLASSKEGSVLFRKVLMCGHLHELILSVELSRFPKYEPTMLQNLVHLTLQENKIEDDPMHLLEMLPHLHTLIFGPDSYVGEIMTCHEWGFPQLSVLVLYQLRNLENLRVDKGAMPKLSTLIIWACPKLEMIPDGLRFVLSLEHLSLYEMPDKFYDRIKDIDDRKGDDYDKIQHVPSVFLDRHVELSFSSPIRSRYNAGIWKNLAFLLCFLLSHNARKNLTIGLLSSNGNGRT